LGRLALARRKDAEAMATKLTGITITVERAAGENGKLFGSVTSKDLEDALREKGVAIDKRQIVLPDSLKSLGETTVAVKLSAEIVAAFTVNVVAKAEA
jgi:large subunit ribosomal protein L9